MASSVFHIDETISRVWRSGRALRHLTNSLITLEGPHNRSTVRDLCVVRNSVGVFQMHKWRTLPHVGREMGILQQNPTFGQHLGPNPTPIPQGHPAHEIVLPSLHQHHLPHSFARRAQSQQCPGPFQEYLRLRSGPCHVIHDSIIRCRPWMNI